MNDVLDSIMDPDRIVIYKCPNGHVMGISMKEYQSDKIYCRECAQEFVKDVKKEN